MLDASARRLHFARMPDIDALTAALANHYTITGELGAGGMATVYRAHDIKHDRDVAIKVLRDDVAESVNKDRFVREIGITARLNHPHILPLLDSGSAAGFLYYVMPLATGESLLDLMRRQGALPIRDALRLGIEVVEALAYAHGHDVVHRDIKPANILLSEGHAVVADFGIATALGTRRDVQALTMDGTSLGTPMYMAPEQATGERGVDSRADIYAIGVLLFEMIAGAPPFVGTWAQIMADKLSKPAPSVATRSPDTPAPLVQLIAECLQREPSERPETADVLLERMRVIANPSTSLVRARSRTPAIFGGTLAAVLVLVAIFAVRERRARWVQDTAVPEIQRLIEADQLDSAFAMTAQVAEREPDNPVVNKFWPDISQSEQFLSAPEGATVTRAALNDTTTWTPVGTTPTGKIRIPNNAWLYRYSKAGYRPVTIMGARLGGSYVPIPAPIPLRRVTDPDSDMAVLSGANMQGTLFGLDEGDTYKLADFLMDHREITNTQYKAFVDAGGYTKRELWDSTIVRDGHPIEWRVAIALFVDKTGRPGPSTWEGGAPVADQVDFPVGGVSWYEARAYARWAGKELPTVLEWNAAAIPAAARWVVPHGRYESTGPVRGGDPRGVGPRGVYDLAGNVREWTVNAREPGSRYILGGGWSDPTYLYSELYTQPELDRSALNGIRLIKRLSASADLARAQAPIPGLTRNFANVKPVDEATFQGYLTQYDYDRNSLNAKVESRDSSEADWTREDVTVDSPAGTGHLPVVMFVPKHAKPPFQTVLIWPASDAQIMPDTKQLPMWIVDFFLRSGRAVVYPVYEGTLGRGMFNEDQTGPIADRDRMIRRIKEMRRAIDYAFARGDVDSTRLAYVGASWGARHGGTAIATDSRIKLAILYVAGLSAVTYRPETDAVNFLPRIRVPVLMLNGKYDSVFPYELSQKPFFRLLGTPAADKKQIVYEGGHFLPRPNLVSESLAWLDHYFGPVNHR